MSKNEDVIVLCSSDEEATPTPQKTKLMYTMVPVPGPSSSRYPAWYRRPVDEGYKMQPSYEDTDVLMDNNKDFSVKNQHNKEPDPKKYVEIKKEDSPLQPHNETSRDLREDWNIASTSGLKRAHHADPAENSAYLRKKFVDKQTENSSLDKEMKNNSQDVEDTPSINETEETDSSDVSSEILDTENSQSTQSSYSENESSVCSDCHDQYSIKYSTEKTNKEIVETILLTSSDDEVSFH